MGMTIEEALKILDHYNHGFCEYSGGLSEPIKVAVDTMRKYQQIKQIYMTHHYTDEDVIEKIKEVIKFG